MGSGKYKSDSLDDALANLRKAFMTDPVVEKEAQKPGVLDQIKREQEGRYEAQVTSFFRNLLKPGGKNVELNGHTYSLGKRIDEGRFSFIMQSEQLDTQTPCVFRTFVPDEKTFKYLQHALQSIRNEFQLLSTLRSCRNIVDCLDIYEPRVSLKYEHEGQVVDNLSKIQENPNIIYLILEQIPNTLDQALEHFQATREKEHDMNFVLDLGQDIANALVAMSVHDIINPDLKPENLGVRPYIVFDGFAKYFQLVKPRTCNYEFVLFDFTHAFVPGDNIPDVVASFAYKAPELPGRVSKQKKIENILASSYSAPEISSDSFLPMLSEKLHTYSAGRMLCEVALRLKGVSRGEILEYYSKSMYGVQSQIKTDTELIEWMNDLRVSTLFVDYAKNWLATDSNIRSGARKFQQEISNLRDHLRVEPDPEPIHVQCSPDLSIIYDD